MTDKHEPASAVAPHRITREAAKDIYDATHGMAPDRRSFYVYFPELIAALAAAGITVEEQP